MSEMKNGLKQLVEDKRELERAIATLVSNFQVRTGTWVSDIRLDDRYHSMDNLTVTRCLVDLVLDPYD